jgi:hypothetical protein
LQYPWDNAFSPEQTLPDDYHENAWDSSEPEITTFFWVRPEYFTAWVSRAPLSTPLLTTSSGAIATGSLGKTGTTVLLGGDSPDDTERHGFRITGGGWLQGYKTIGLEASVFVMGDRYFSAAYTAASTPSGLLARPVVNALTGKETTDFVNQASTFSGRFDFNYRTSFIGTDEYFVFNLDNAAAEYPEFLAGFRLLDLAEQINMFAGNQVLANGIVGFGPLTTLGRGNSIGISDRFATHNQFYGGEVGLRKHCELDWFFYEFVGKFGFGTTRQIVNVEGSTQVIASGGTP